MLIESMTSWSSKDPHLDGRKPTVVTFDSCKLLGNNPSHSNSTLDSERRGERRVFAIDQDGETADVFIC